MASGTGAFYLGFCFQRWDFKTLIVIDCVYDYNICLSIAFLPLDLIILFPFLIYLNFSMIFLYVNIYILLLWLLQ